MTISFYGILFVKKGFILSKKKDILKQANAHGFYMHIDTWRRCKQQGFILFNNTMYNLRDYNWNTSEVNNDVWHISL